MNLILRSKIKAVIVGDGGWPYPVSMFRGGLDGARNISRGEDVILLLSEVLKGTVNDVFEQQTATN